MVTLVTSEINHINFVKSYLIKTKEELQILNSSYDEDGVIVQTNVGEFKLLDFPKDHLLFFNCKKISDEEHTIILAIKEPLTGWFESE